MRKIRKSSFVVAWLLVISMVIPAVPPVVTSQAAEENSGITYDYNAMAIDEILAIDDRPLTWVFAGDSITHNAVWSQGMNSYAEWFEQYLYDIDRRDDSVIVTAWGGADIYDFQTRENEEKEPTVFKGQGSNADPGMGLEQMITKYSPDVLFIKLGMNDRYKTTARYEKYYNQMLDSIYASGSVNGKKPKLVLLTPTPISGESIYNTEQTDADSTWRFQKSLTKIAKERGLLLCDLATAFTQEALAVGADYSRLFFSDPSDGGVHPNAAGQYLIFKTLSKTLGIYDETMPIYQLEYLDLNRAALYTDETYIGKTEEYDGAYGNAEDSKDAVDWASAVAENNVWVVAGGTQMSGYHGPVVNRSLFRCVDNALRSATCLASTNNGTSRDNRMISVAAPGRTPAELNAKYDELIARHDHQVFLLLPEVPEVYGAEYAHATDAVAEYKAAVTELLNKEKEAGKICILWTPLASEDAVLNGYLDAYAQAVREIAAADSSILFFDANRFMNEKMNANAAVQRSWFEDDGHLSPLGALDVAYGFHCHIKLLNTDGGGMELLVHNLRLSTDARVFKGDYVRDLIPSEVTVEGTQVTVDTAPIRAVYPNLTNLRLVLLPGAGAGNYHEQLRQLGEVTTVTETDGKYSFEAPCSNPILAVYGEQDGKTYRFKDLPVKVTTTAVIQEEKSDPDGAYLDSLAVVGAPAIASFEKSRGSYEVTLYQYQRNVQILAKAQQGLTITVNGEKVESGAYSQLVSVDKTATVAVKVSGMVAGRLEEKTYTLKLARPENPDIIITEVMTDGYYQYEEIRDSDGKKYGADNYELIEIYNASGRDLNLLDYSIGFKNDYTYVDQITSGGKWPYYFTGNDQAFQSTHNTGKVATYTGINQITKYSSYWADGSVEEPEEVLFPADSTMVIWVKSSPSGDLAKRYGETLTYETLRAALEKHKGTHTLTVDMDGNETAVVPAKEQLVVAEVPMGIAGRGQTGRAKQTADKANKNFLLGNVDAHAVGVVDNATRKIAGARSWLFVLKDTAEQAENGAITEAGDDIISAARYVRPGKAAKKTAADGTVSYVAEGGTAKLSSVFSYDTDRGMSLVKNETFWDADTIGQAHTSDQQGYSNLTSFGAIEYWQKPKDLADETAPAAEVTAKLGENNNLEMGLALGDNEDLRYIEVKVWGDDHEQAVVKKKDLVLESGVRNKGISQDVTSYSDIWLFPMDPSARTVSWQGYVVDGNGNRTEFCGSERLAIPTEPMVKRYSNIAEFRGADGYTAPELAGYVFAGWFSNKKCTAPIEAYVRRGSAYAKFVPEEILGVKAQVTANLLDDDDTNDGTGAIRFVTSVDSLEYREIGFLFDITGNDYTLTRSSNTVYDTLYAVDPEKGVQVGENYPLIYTPQETFCSMSTYFKTYTFYGLKKETDYDKIFKVTPFWVTLDGTTVYGAAVEKTVRQGIDELQGR